MRCLHLLLLLLVTSNAIADPNCSAPEPSWITQSSCDSIDAATSLEAVNWSIYRYAQNQKLCSANDFYLSLRNYENKLLETYVAECEFKNTCMFLANHSLTYDSCERGDIDDMFFCESNQNEKLLAVLMATDLSTEGCEFPKVSAITNSNNKINYSPSFDCSKASTKIENTICADNDLSLRDQYLTYLYKHSLQITDNAEELRSNQRSWIKERKSCLKSTSSARCLTGKYIYQINKLEVYLFNKMKSNNTTER